MRGQFSRPRRSRPCWPPRAGRRCSSRRSCSARPSERLDLGWRESGQRPHRNADQQPAEEREQAGQDCGRDPQRIAVLQRTWRFTSVTLRIADWQLRIG